MLRQLKVDCDALKHALSSSVSAGTVFVALPVGTCLGIPFPHDHERQAGQSWRSPARLLLPKRLCRVLP